MFFVETGPRADESDRLLHRAKFDRRRDIQTAALPIVYHPQSPHLHRFRQRLRRRSKLPFPSAPRPLNLRLKPFDLRAAKRRARLKEIAAKASRAPDP